MREQGAAKDPMVYAAFRDVPRHTFLPDLPPEQVYEDTALVTKRRADGMPISSSSMPTIMAQMLDQLDLARGHKVLEIGTGTGYNASLVSHIVGKSGTVVTVDIQEDVIAEARHNLSAAGYENVRVMCADGAAGIQEYAPFDRIIATVGAWEPPRSWLQQLQPNGRIVLPLALRAKQVSVALERGEGYWQSRSIRRCGFMTMIGTAAGPEAAVQFGPVPAMYVLSADGHPVDSGKLLEALSSLPADISTGVLIDGFNEVYDLELWLDLAEPQLLRLVAMGAAVKLHLVPALLGTADGASTVALMDGGRVAALIRGDEAREVVVRGFAASEDSASEDSLTEGVNRPARRLADHIRDWDERGRPEAPDLSIRVWPSGATVDQESPSYKVIAKRNSVITLEWA